MSDARASFGCLFNPRGQGSIIVAGGYINGKLTDKCEMYSIKDNKWYPLPEMTETKASGSLCILNDRYLICFGGLSRNANNQAFLTNSIEILDLESVGNKWVKCETTLPISGCDIGCIPVRHNELLIFGGWNKNA